MALTMIDPTSSWFEIVELPLVNVVKRLQTINVNGKELLTLDETIDKSSDRIAKLINKT